ncbi:MAG: hypothetical protein AAGG75_01815 [Bacteroidota bacterium]
MKNLSTAAALAYWKKEGLDHHFAAHAEKQEQGVFDTVSGQMEHPIPPDLQDLVRLHRLIRERMSFTVLEFGVGFSTIVIADALQKNKADWKRLEQPPKLRNRFLFQCFSVDSSAKWLERSQERLPEQFKDTVHFQFSRVEIGTFNGQLCHFYKNLPDIVPDFIYLDGPDPQTVEGTINGMSFQCMERTVMSGDLLLMEPILLPGTFVLVDGRTNNARFLKNNFKRAYEVIWDRQGDVTTFELIEDRLGKYNILGKDYIQVQSVKQE